MGRPLTLSPSGDAMTTYTYRSATAANSLARVTVARVASPGAPALAESRVDFDALGRPVTEEQRMPDGNWSARKTVYNALGWKTFISEQGSTFGTSILAFDAFGRPLTIQPADSASHTVSVTYSGVRQISRTVKVATSATSETGAKTTEVYDRHGRLYEVTEPNSRKARYDYDVGNRLAKVCQDVNATGSCGQTRLFTYDNRGFLLSEQHPEKTAANSATYDALGHPVAKVDGPNNQTFVYDKAGRLTLIRESGSGFIDCANNNGHRCLKAFTYASANGTGATDYKKGKLVAASRYNYVSAPFNAAVEVKESYVYGGPGGRTSQKDTVQIFNGTQLESFRQSFSWDSLGNLSSQGYPDCIAPTVCGSSQPRAVGNGYTNGFLTSVSGFVPSITYAANGMVSQVTHSNAVVDVQTIDSTGMPRPTGMRSIKGSAELWNAGSPFQYDGAGNLWKQGAHTYIYDSLSRLTSATLYDAPAGNGTSHLQTFTYDNFGNLQSLTTDGTLLNTPTSSATNHLTAGDYSDTTQGLGNLTAWSGSTYEYDAFNQMKRMVSGAEDWRYIYTAGDERFWMYRVGGGGSVWTLRGLDAKVLREYQAHVSWGTFKDYVYRGSTLLAEADSAALGSAVRHLHADHLGTVRAVSNAAGQRVAYHLYYPYGQELTAFNQDTERMKFTGHERDLANLAGAGDDLDYMHARHASPISGRFMTTDWVSGTPKKPQSWNRYTYARGNPLKYVDPNGLDVVVATGDRAIVAFAYANSATFRAQFDAANQNHNILVRLSIGSSKAAGHMGGRGDTKWNSNPGMVAPSRTYKGAINSLVVRQSNQAALGAMIGHELTHANELAKYGDIKKAPGAREAEGATGSYETKDARVNESLIRQELGSGEGHQSLSPEDLAEVFSPSSEWDGLTDSQRSECLSNVACLALFGSAPDPR